MADSLIKSTVEALLHRVWRAVARLRRPSPRKNRIRLAAVHESVDSLLIRDVQSTDLVALAELHVRTWNDTYAPLRMSGPPVTVRHRQWLEKFSKRAPGWFCLVVQRANGELIGFAEGRRKDDSEGTAELSKLYLAREYQRVGLGRRLLCTVVDRFIEGGWRSMMVFVDPRNPSCDFWETFGGVNLRGQDGQINYSWYVWPDLPDLARRCSTSMKTNNAKHSA